MGIDVSFLLTSTPIPDATLLEAAAKLEHDGPQFLLVGDASSVPAVLGKAMPDVRVVSVWGADLDEPWDDVVAALSRAAPDATLLAVTMSDHGGVGCWQLVEGGAFGPAHWLEEDYPFGIVYGLAEGFGFDLDVDDPFFAETVCMAAARGWRLPEERSLDPAGIEAAIDGYALPLEHPGEQVAPEPPPPAPTPTIEAAGEADQALVAALGALTIKSPGKRMFVEDLQRCVANGSALTAGQRDRAQKLLDELG